MLDSHLADIICSLLLLLHGIDDIKCYLQQHPTFDVKFFHLSYIQHAILDEINVSNIYVITSGSLLQQNNIHR